MESSVDKLRAQLQDMEAQHRADRAEARELRARMDAMCAFTRPDGATPETTTTTTVLLNSMAQLWSNIQALPTAELVVMMLWLGCLAAMALSMARAPTVASVGRGQTDWVSRGS